MCEWIFAGVSPPGATSAEGGEVVPHRARYQRRRGSGRTPRRRPCGAAPTSPPEGVFRHKRRMELDELSGRITGRLGYTCRLEPTPSEGRQRWHYDALASSRNRRRPHSSSGMTVGRRGLLGMGTAAASAGAAGPSQGLRAGWSSGRTEAGVHRGEQIAFHKLQNICQEGHL